MSQNLNPALTHFTIGFGETDLHLLPYPLQPHHFDIVEG